MTTVKALYSSSTTGTPITWTSAAALTNGSAAGCAAIDNTSNLYIDVSVYIAIGVGTVASPKYINIWFAASEDGTNYTGNSVTTDAYAGSDAAVTLGAPPSFFGPFTFPTQQATATTHIIITSVRDAFGGLMIPKKWGMIVENQCGASFTAMAAEYTGYQLTNA